MESGPIPAVLGVTTMGWLVRPRIIAAAGLVLTSGMAGADCMKNTDGQVICGKGQCARDGRGVILCSAFAKGSAVFTSDGRIVCGKGRCVKTSRGTVICSTEPEGAVLIDRYGVARCQGECERASADYCEARLAGSGRE